MKTDLLEKAAVDYAKAVGEHVAKVALRDRLRQQLQQAENEVEGSADKVKAAETNLKKAARGD